MNILFVDDESRILQGLRRMLHTMRKQWNMSFVSSGAEALKLLSHTPMDVVVSDMRMPGMDGAELLSRIKEEYPDIVRIILSGHADEEMILKSVGPAHQFLSKPCDANVLVKTVKRAYYLRRIILSDKIRRIITHIDSLPSLPALYTRIMNEIQKEEPSIKNIADIVEQDISMTAKILQLVNSAFFGLPRHISTPVDAVNLLGIETIRSLALTIQVFSQFEFQENAPVKLDLLWSHSMKSGKAARWVGKKLNLEPREIDYVYLSGLLHDIGKLVLVSNFPDQYHRILIRAQNENIPLDTAELDTLGVSHANVGGYLLGVWGLPDPIIEGVTFHHMPLALEGDPEPCVIATHLANYLSYYNAPALANQLTDKISRAVLQLPELKKNWKNWLGEWAALQ